MNGVVVHNQKVRHRGLGLNTRNFLLPTIWLEVSAEVSLKYRGITVGRQSAEVIINLVGSLKPSLV